MYDHIKAEDSEVYSAIMQEIGRQRNKIELIASENMVSEAVLEAAGSSVDKVVKTVVFIKDMNDFAKVNEIYAKYFTDNYPARSCVEVARLPKDVLIEIEAVAEV